MRRLAVLLLVPLVACQAVNLGATNEPACQANSDCDDNNPCTTDSCDAKTGKCLVTPIIGCGGYCKTEKDCKADSNVCTDAKCISGKCINVANTAKCSDGISPSLF